MPGLNFYCQLSGWSLKYFLSFGKSYRINSQAPLPFTKGFKMIICFNDHFHFYDQMIKFIFKLSFILASLYNKDTLYRKMALTKEWWIEFGPKFSVCPGKAQQYNFVLQCVWFYLCCNKSSVPGIVNSPSETFLQTQFLKYPVFSWA